MPIWLPLSAIRLVTVGLLVACAAASGAKAQEPAPRLRIAPHRSVLPGGTSRHRTTTATPRVAYRSLTVNRRPETAPDGADEGDNVLVDGPIRYGDIHSFDPAPYVSSGQQFPYGFDGIGGYGSDLGMGAGQNASIYDRGL